MQDQLNCSTFTPQIKLNTQSFGLRWEAWAGEQLTDLGYHVSIPADFFAPYDLKVAKSGHSPLLHVEVKAATKTYRYVRSGYLRPRWQFDTSGGLNHMTTDHVYILVSVSDITGEIVPFIVPSWIIAGRQQVQLTSDPIAYKGKLLAEYRNAWNVIDHVYATRQRLYFNNSIQKSFDFEVMQ